AARPGQRSAGRPRTGSGRLRVEVLEERTLLSAGDLDPTFGTGGKVLADYTAGAVAVQPDGKILVAATSSAGGSSIGVLTRYDADGSLDMNFGTSGKISVNSLIARLAVEPNGKLIAEQEPNPRAPGASQLLCFNANGTPDAGFGSNGTITLASAISSLIIQP